MNFLDRNEFNYMPSPQVIEAIKNFDPMKLCFYTRIYDEGKKSIFSVKLSEIYGIDESRIILGYGGEDILKNAIHFFLAKPGNNRKILIPKFSWWYYASLAKEVNGETILYPIFEAEDSFKYDKVVLKQMLEKEKPAALLLASPNNPTGNCLSPDDIDDIMSWTPKDTVVVIDEAYASFITEDSSYVKPLVDKYPNLLITRTLSKFFGLPGLRMGFAFMGENLAGDFARYANKYLGYNCFSEEVAMAAINSESYYRNIADNMELDRQMYSRELGSLPGFKVYKSTANFILIKYPVALKQKLQQEFKNADFKIKFMDEPDLNEHMRITLGRREQNKIVAEIIKKTAVK